MFSSVLTPNHHVGSCYPFKHIHRAYDADEASDDKPPFLLYCDGQIMALCLRTSLHPKTGEIWVSANAAIAEWGKQLATHKGKNSLPVYYTGSVSNIYEFKGHHSITDHTEDPKELAKRKCKIPLSRIVFISLIKDSAH